MESEPEHHIHPIANGQLKDVDTSENQSGNLLTLSEGVEIKAEPLDSNTGLTSKDVPQNQFYPHIELSRPKSDQGRATAAAASNEGSVDEDEGWGSSHLKEISEECAEEPSEVFPTQVDESTLLAAKERQRSKSTVFDLEEWEPTHPQTLSLSELVACKAQQHFEKGVAQFEGKNYDKAICCINKAIRLRPKEVNYYVQRGEAHLQLCDFQSAILNYKRACVLESDNNQHYTRLAFLYYFYGQCLFDQKLFPESLEAFSRAAEMRPEVVGYHMRTIACLAALNRHGECLALINKRLETDLQNADLYILRARLHELFHNTTLCYYDVKDALGFEPSHQEALLLQQSLQQQAVNYQQQATQLHLMGRHRDALQKISISIETNPSVADFHVLRGAIHRRLYDFNAAIDDYLLALDKTDHDEENVVYIQAQRQLLLTYNDFAVECFTKAFYEEAIILLNKAIKGEKREKGLYVNRGDCFFKEGNMQFAIADYHQALEMHPNDPDIQSRIAIIHNEYGIQEFEEKSYQEAESRFTLAIQHNPRIGQYYVSRCRARQMMENMSAAKTDILMGLLLEPNNPEIIAILARLFPGKSVKDVLASRAALQAHQALENLVVMASPIRLKPLQDRDGDEEEEVGGEDEECGDSSAAFESAKKSSLLKSEATASSAATASAAAASDSASSPHLLPCTPQLSVPTLRSCMQEHDFNISILTQKKKVDNKVKKMLHHRQNLKYPIGRVQSELPAASPFTRVAGQPVMSDGKVLINNAPAKKKGWKNYGCGVGAS